MPLRSEWPNAQRVAEAYLRRATARGLRQPSSWPVADRMTGPTAVYWWDDNTPVFEVSLYDGDTPAGYVIVSGTRRLPPILEAGPTGTAPSTRLIAEMTAHLARTGRYATTIRWQYWSALEIVGEVTLQDGSVVYIRAPEMCEETMSNRLAIQRDPTRYWRTDDLEKRWEEWITPLGKTGPSSIGIILESREPIYYNQNCRPALSSQSEPPTYCTPNCISGCVPVAVAMLSSSWKKVNIAGSQGQIWPGSACWNIAWPSSTSPDPNCCVDVNQSIWDLHDAFSTGCGGLTFGNRVAAPTTAYYRNTWGLNWSYQYQFPATYEYCTDIITRRHPFVFMAVGQWSAYLQQMAPKLAAPPIASGQAGHAVVCWGFNASPWVGGPALLIGLGWGSAWASRWIEYDSFTQPQALYVAAFQ